MRAERELKPTDCLFRAKRLSWSKYGGVRVPCLPAWCQKDRSPVTGHVSPTSLNIRLLICNIGIFIYTF